MKIVNTCPELQPEDTYKFQPDGAEFEMILPRHEILAVPEGKTHHDAIRFLAPNEATARAFDVDFRIHFEDLARERINCAGVVEFILDGKELGFVLQSDPPENGITLDHTQLDLVGKFFELPCGFQLWNHDTYVHGGVFFGEHNGEFYIYHKLGPEKTEFVEIAHGLHYYPDHTHMIFYGNRIGST